MAPESSLLRSKLYWVGVLYFAEGFPLGVFYEIFPVYFRQQGIELRSIGVLSPLGLAWTLKFLWAPAIDYWRHHRRWMATVDIAMGVVMLSFAGQAGFGPITWIAIGVFTALSATKTSRSTATPSSSSRRTSLGWRTASGPACTASACWHRASC